MDLCGSESEKIIQGYLIQDLNKLINNSLLDLKEKKPIKNSLFRIPSIVYSFMFHSRSNSYVKFLVNFFNIFYLILSKT